MADGSWRPSRDFRRLNLVTETDVYLLPNMLDFAARAAGCTVFSKIDLRKGYHQIPVNPEGVQKTANTTPFGLFEYKRMPFGLWPQKRWGLLPAARGQGNQGLPGSLCLG
jgi:hypothetical protein